MRVFFFGAGFLDFLAGFFFAMPHGRIARLVGQRGNKPNCTTTEAYHIAGFCVGDERLVKQPMKTYRAFIALLGACSVASVSLADVNSVSAAEKAEGWKSLFDGVNLNGWRGYNADKPGEGWAVVDGTIMVKSKGGDLLTKDAFGDFELSFDWKVTETANSGVIYRVGLGERASYITGPEYQVLDNEKAEDNKQHDHLAASLYDLALELNAKTKPVGEWNSGRIRVRGWHVEHWLNGEKVVDVDLASPAGKAMIQSSKFKDWEKFASLPRGHIALQEHGHDVSFRAIKIRELR